MSIKQRQNIFTLKLFADKKNIDIIVNNNNRNYLMNILCCVAILNELGLNLNKVKKFFKNQTPLKGREELMLLKNLIKGFFN